MGSRARYCLSIALLLPPVAEAHVAVQTYALLAGALHPWINQDSALLLAAVTLWIAQRARSSEISYWVANAVALSAGVGAGLAVGVAGPAWLSYAATVVVAVAVSARLLPPAVVWRALLALAALLAGYYAGVDAAAAVPSVAVFVLGVLAGGFVFPLSVAVLLANQQVRLVQVGTRVLGSWLAAIGLMLCALRLAG